MPALRSALRGRPEEIVSEVIASGLRGRGGAAFPAGVKWRAVSEALGPKYVVCNADESEPGTFKDRALMEADPFRLIEAITIAGYATGATRGYVYVRGEYSVALGRVQSAITEVRQAGYLGPNIADSGFPFEIEVRKGAGAYVCGEETALFNSIEGFRGEPRQKPPFPTQAGLFGKPTLVNNVETLMSIPDIILGGAAEFIAIGSGESTGSKLFCVSGNVAEPGVYEAPFGVTTDDLIALAGGVDGELAAVLVGGAAGSFLTDEQRQIPLTFEDTAAAGISLGSGAVIVFNETVDMPAILLRIAHFFSEESCGLCVPCRIGTVRQEEALVRMIAGDPARRELSLMAGIDSTLRDASICGLGQMASSAVQTAIALGLVGVES